MTAKERILDLIIALPDDCSESQIEQQLFRYKVQAGLRSAQAEPLTDQADVEKLIDQWLEE